MPEAVQTLPVSLIHSLHEAEKTAPAAFVEEAEAKITPAAIAEEAEAKTAPAAIVEKTEQQEKVSEKIVQKKAENVKEFSHGDLDDWASDVEFEKW